MSDIAAERDYYRALLDLGEAGDPDALTRSALELVMRVTRSACGVIDTGASRITEGLGEDRVGALSVGILEATRGSGDVVQTTSAHLDERFRERESVRRARIEAVLCVPIGAQGVLYLQRRAGEGPYTPGDVDHARMLVRQLAPLLRLLGGADGDDPTAPWRKRLEGNEELIGRSAALAAVLREAAVVAPRPLSVLLTGPTGTGKSALARLIHANSARRDGPLVEVNCASIPTELAESELFGAARGAHSTAARDRIGHVVAADGGTLFLDEVAELPPPVQAKLLRVLQEGRYRRLGDTRDRALDLRVIAATHRDLTRSGFRSDLYYRLAGFQIALPSLAARGQDVAHIADALLDAACGRAGVGRPRASAAFIASLVGRPWPGNVRELKALVERFALLGELEDVFTPDPAPSSYKERLQAFQRELIREALATHDGSVARAAEAIGMSRSRLYELVAELRLD